MKTFIFLCVILLCSCAAKFDLNASKSDDIFHHFTILIIKMNKQNKFPLSVITTLFLSQYYFSIYENNMSVKLIIWSSCADVNSHNKVVVCYVNSWAAKRSGNGKFLVENIDPMLCTHIIYGYAHLDIITYSIQSQFTFIDLEEGGGRGKKLKKKILNMHNFQFKFIFCWNIFGIVQTSTEKSST